MEFSKYLDKCLTIFSLKKITFIVTNINLDLSTFMICLSHFHSITSIKTQSEAAHLPNFYADRNEEESKL